MYLIRANHSSAFCHLSRHLVAFLLYNIRILGECNLVRIQHFSYHDQGHKQNSRDNREVRTTHPVTHEVVHADVQQHAHTTF